MYRVYMPLPDPVEAEYLRRWNADAPWRMAGFAILLACAVTTSTLYYQLAKMAVSAFSG
jgi:hypothetical protein